ncbi:hypothetical protein NLJ89_g8899 [Agrocybe chaxingu]|uniref:Uncharacterized protein n=1 Tax=Agrocybe chaxingu TaxID=84603 RepID=A0A9W8JRS9_9AGAR|nr:hypothetical protein NLJ89_g8899 [Agrocybe chaxingu]
MARTPAWSAAFKALHSSLCDKLTILEKVLRSSDHGVIEVMLEATSDVASQVIARIEADKVPASDITAHEPLFKLRQAYETHEEASDGKYTFPAKYRAIRSFLRNVLERRNVQEARPSEKARSSKSQAARTKSSKSKIKSAPIVIEPDDSEAEVLEKLKLVLLTARFSKMNVDDSGAAPVPAVTEAAPANPRKRRNSLPVAVESKTFNRHAETTQLPFAAVPGIDTNSAAYRKAAQLDAKRPRIDAPAYPDSTTVANTLSSIVHNSATESVIAKARNIATSPFVDAPEDVLRSTLHDQSVSVQVIAHKIYALLQMYDILVSQYDELVKRLEDRTQRVQEGTF